MFKAADLWAQAWPDVPFEEASAQDVELFTHHAQALNDYTRYIDDIGYFWGGSDERPMNHNGERG